MITRVNRVRDSMNAKPRTSRSWMPARAPGLRASASQAEAVALPCPRPQSPAAKAMPMPAPIGTRLTAADPPSANGETKRGQGHKHILKFPHISPASLGFGRQWVVEAHRAGPLTLAALRLPGA